MTVKANCRNCGKRYEKSKHRSNVHHFCSRECWKENEKKKRININRARESAIKTAHLKVFMGDYPDEII